MSDKQFKVAIIVTILLVVFGGALYISREPKPEPQPDYRGKLVDVNSMHEEDYGDFIIAIEYTNTTMIDEQMYRFYIDDPEKGIVEEEYKTIYTYIKKDVNSADEAFVEMMPNGFYRLHVPRNGKIRHLEMEEE